MREGRYVNLFQQKKKKKAPNIILGRTRMYIRLYKKVDLLSRTEKRYLWLAGVNFHNCLSIIYMYTQRFLGRFSYVANNFCATAGSSQLVRQFPLVRRKFAEK